MWLGFELSVVLWLGCYLVKRVWQGCQNSFTKIIYRQLQSVSRIWINEVQWLFLGQFWPLLKPASFFEASGAVVEIIWSLQIMNFNQVKLAQIPETHCRSFFIFRHGQKMIHFLLHNPSFGQVKEACLLSSQVLQVTIKTC